MVRTITSNHYYIMIIIMIRKLMKIIIKIARQSPQWLNKESSPQLQGQLRASTKQPTKRNEPAMYGFCKQLGKTANP